MKKILYLEKRGCDFWDNDQESRSMSDVGNYRVGSYDYSIHGKDGKDYILEFGKTDRKEYVTHAKNGRELKHPKWKIVQKNALCIDTQFENSEGAWRNSDLEKQLREKKYSYTLTDILKCVNEISTDTYTEIQFIN